MTLTIEHAEAEGTLLHGTSRGDGSAEVVKGAGLAVGAQHRAVVRSAQQGRGAEVVADRADRDPAAGGRVRGRGVDRHHDRGPGRAAPRRTIPGAGRETGGPGRPGAG